MTFSRRNILLAAPAIIVSRKAYGWSHGADGLHINLSYQANALAAPQAFRDAVQTAATMVENACQSTPITISLTVEYGTINGGALTGTQSGSTSAGFFTLSYTALKTAIGNNIRTSTMQSLFNSLGAGSSYGGVSTWFSPLGCSKALGLVAPRTGSDGAIGFSTGVPAGNMVGAALHEIRQAIGGLRGSGQMQDLSTFTGSGAVDTTGTATAYFSINGGVTNLANFDNTGHDASDFLNGGAHELIADYDPFDALFSANTNQRLTPLDVINLNALGFQ